MEVIQLVGREITDSYPGTSFQEELTKPIPEAPPKITKTVFHGCHCVVFVSPRETMCRGVLFFISSMANHKKLISPMLPRIEPWMGVSSLH